VVAAAVVVVVVVDVIGDITIAVSCVYDMGDSGLMVSSVAVLDDVVVVAVVVFVDVVLLVVLYPALFNCCRSILISSAISNCRSLRE
jgi:hypothetical protein